MKSKIISGEENSMFDILTDDVDVDLKRMKPWQRGELFIVILKVEMRRVFTVYLKFTTSFSQKSFKLNLKSSSLEEQIKKSLRFS